MSTLDPQAQVLLDAAIASGLPPVYTLPTEESRARMRSTFIQGAPESIASIRNLSIPGPLGGLPIRL